jgi:hypothetical protein
MRKLTIVMCAAMVALSPTPALAAVCFVDQAGEVISLEVIGSVGGILTVAGRFITNQGPVTSPTVHLPVTGVGFLRSDGNATVGLTVHGVSATQSPFIIQGVLNGPSFNSGRGVGENVNSGVQFVLDWTPASCPLFP